ncbi:hypothetical protein M0R45_007150 [Rubus argutus]|uniref:Uncharacterized protein n=1 Tax=Rubus argutus TaxID=59490 RepID=A0AAW1YSP1_RUBAR
MYHHHHRCSPINTRSQIRVKRPSIQFRSRSITTTQKPPQPRSHHKADPWFNIVTPTPRDRREEKTPNSQTCSSNTSLNPDLMENSTNTHPEESTPPVITLQSC